MMFIYVLLRPLISIAMDFIKPLLILGVLVMLDIALGIGITNTVIQTAMDMLKQQLPYSDVWGNYL